MKMNCSQVEADLIHKQAQAQRRSITGYVLHIVLRHIETDEMVAKGQPFLAVWKQPPKASGPRTTFLIRCSGEESDRIRAAAERRAITISGYVLYALRHTWKVQMELGLMPPPPPEFEP